MTYTKDVKMWAVRGLPDSAKTTNAFGNGCYKGDTFDFGNITQITGHVQLLFGGPVGVVSYALAVNEDPYGEPHEHPQNEHTTPLNSRLPYAVVKNVGEAFLRSYKKEFDLDYTIFRFFNTYGPKQSIDFVMSEASV